MHLIKDDSKTKCPLFVLLCIILQNGLVLFTVSYAEHYLSIKCVITVKCVHLCQCNVLW